MSRPGHELEGPGKDHQHQDRQRADKKEMAFQQSWSAPKTSSFAVHVPGEAGGHTPCAVTERWRRVASLKQQARLT
jgi:hypothetical protein